MGTPLDAALTKGGPNVYERILVPLDGSESAEAVLPFAEKVAGPLDAEVILLQAIPASRAGFVVAARVQAECYLGSLADRLASKGIRVQTGIRFGSAPAAILGAADAWDADLIAMATHGRTGLDRLLFGSVAEAVLREAQVPVLMIRTSVKAATPAGERTPSAMSLKR
jgi:nucleotide-binding universal stress UspA family protein